MKKALLIAGHGKNYNGTYDPGACSKFGKEAEYTRELVAMVQKRLGAYADVYDTGKNCYSYSKAGQVPNYSAYAVVGEFHFNAKTQKDENGDGRFTGIGAYVHPNNAGGKAIAEKIINAVVALGFRKWQICTSTGLLNLNNAQKAGVKYFLLETAFLDDGDDMNWYNSHKEQIADEIAKVIAQELGVTVDTPVQSDVIYRVQVGAFSDRGNAERMLAKVKAAGYDTYMVNVDGQYKIQVGAFTEKKYAESMCDKLKSVGFDAFITTRGCDSTVPAKKKRYVKVLVPGIIHKKKDSWDDSAICGEVKKNEVFTIAEGPMTVGNGKMYKLESGVYITASSKYVEVFEK